MWVKPASINFRLGRFFVVEHNSMGQWVFIPRYISEDIRLAENCKVDVKFKRFIGKSVWVRQLLDRKKEENCYNQLDVSKMKTREKEAVLN